ncbi:glutathione hydrolase 1 proenzyme-like isoform X1 [Hemiscyllium ocellatum]|uniref:glutathione hydrolase 1 proenzyme-like isoform X1 n=1 Tax=Hemiscyllium ocellatum TaxID=170820 RepID=UPI00296658C1|nr:glutathione hydrolase 1 proenzyme-like isoform X1 [Hemiscyllium ocellatum]XP_060699842.1 glutathione hydrolase 1 proenzyme-like isoform X1 [Hemiscyllium ocellatum]
MKAKVVFIIALILVCVFVLVLYFALKPAYPFERNNSCERNHSFEKAAVATDAEKCSEIGRYILRQNGSAVDAAIASLLCIGVMNAQYMGIGGGFFMTIYNAQTGEVETINAREVAPNNASENMFRNNREASSKGGLAIAVPGEIRGYQLAHERHGRLPWKQLFEPSIKLANEGFPISRFLAEAIRENKVYIENNQSLCEVFCNSKGNILQENDTIKFPKLAKTYQILADEGADAFYNGPLSQTIVTDIRNAGGIITLEDLRSYRAHNLSSKDMVNISIGDYTLFVPSAPTSGPMLALILNILKGYNFTSDSVSSPKQRALTYHRIVEAFKFAFAKRGMMGDPQFVNITEFISNMTSEYYAAKLWSKITDNTTHPPEYYEPEFYTTDDHGTSHLSLVAEDGSAVSVTSTINLEFGSKVRSRINGIIFNDEMDDFSSPGTTNSYGLRPSSANFIKPGKVPLSSMCPVILLDQNKSVKMVVGASGGPRIITATAQVIMNVLWFNYTVKDAVTKPRIHNQLNFTVTEFEKDMEEAIKEGLEERNHTLNETDPTLASAVQAIVRDKGKLFAESDYREGGWPAGY